MSISVIDCPPICCGLSSSLWNMIEPLVSFTSVAGTSVRVQYSAIRTPLSPNQSPLKSLLPVTKEAAFASFQRRLNSAMGIQSVMNARFQSIDVASVLSQSPYTANGLATRFRTMSWSHASSQA
jgi:hypothetical protein